MKALLQLQGLDLRIESRKNRELNIPKQKDKFDIITKRLKAELNERETMCQNIVLEQRECESEIEQKQEQVTKYEQQLNLVKKNEEYQALLHEIDLLQKQIGIKEERIIALMLESDEANARLKEDQKRIQDELEEVDRQCTEIDRELLEAIEERKSLELERTPISDAVDSDLLRRYERIRLSKNKSCAVVPLRGDACGGCHMAVTAQIHNEILGGTKVHTCAHCGRLLYHQDNFDNGVENEYERQR